MSVAGDTKLLLVVAPLPRLLGNAVSVGLEGGDHAVEDVFIFRSGRGSLIVCGDRIVTVTANGVSARSGIGATVAVWLRFRARPYLGDPSILGEGAKIGPIERRQLARCHARLVSTSVAA